MHPESEQNRSSTLGPQHLNPIDIFLLKNFFKVSSNSCMDFIFNPIIYCQN